MADRLEIHYTVADRMHNMAFINVSLDAMQRQGFPLPNVAEMTEPARDIALHIRDVLNLPYCYMIHLENSFPPETAAVFLKDPKDEIV